ncbi:hypothetical protein CHARACLAT_027775 [Characodon lateralis]|uniref:Secreted protein n=1 Tax=Characodon lateralis TaxID=208331 RepID=A0ABU7EGM5_9TELE|nr:hypothetical protein [Characodon lateralis]
MPSSSSPGCLILAGMRIVPVSMCTACFSVFGQSSSDSLSASDSGHVLDCFILSPVCSTCLQSAQSQSSVCSAIIRLLKACHQPVSHYPSAQSPHHLVTSGFCLHLHLKDCYLPVQLVPSWFYCHLPVQAPYQSACLNFLIIIITNFQ